MSEEIISIDLHRRAKCPDNLYIVKAVRRADSQYIVVCSINTKVNDYACYFKYGDNPFFWENVADYGDKLDQATTERLFPLEAQKYTWRR